MRIAAVVLGLALLSASPALADEGLVGRAAFPDGSPVQGATFIAVGADGRTYHAATDGRGDAVFASLPPGHYTLVAVYGDQKGQSYIDVAPGTMTRSGFVFKESDGEVIRIHEQVGPSKEAEPELKTKIGRLPYSEEMLSQNLYAVVWLLVDVDVRGRATRATVLKAPRGIGIEELAVEEALKLEFAPARNPSGQVIASSVLVVLEWPPYYAWASGKSVQSVCAGSGPLNLDTGDNGVLVYRDCDPPAGFEKARSMLATPPRAHARDMQAAWKRARRTPLIFETKVTR